MRVLAAHYADFDSIGTLYSRTSGKRHIVEIELVFPGDSMLSDLEGLGAVMERELEREVPGLTFRIVPLAG